MRCTWRVARALIPSVVLVAALATGCAKDKPAEVGPAGTSPNEKTMSAEEMKAWGQSMAQKAKSGQLNIPQDKMGSKAQVPAPGEKAK